MVDPWNRLDSDVSCRFSASVLLESTSEEFSTECDMLIHAVGWILTYTYRASSVPIFSSLETTPVKFSTNCDVVDPWNRLDSDVSCQASASVSLETASVEFSTKGDMVDPCSWLDSHISCLDVVGKDVCFNCVVIHVSIKLLREQDSAQETMQQS